MEYYSTTKNDFMKFTGKWMILKTIILSEIRQFQKNQKLDVFSDMWKLTSNKMGEWIGRIEVQQGEKGVRVWKRKDSGMNLTKFSYIHI